MRFALRALSLLALAPVALAQSAQDAVVEEVRSQLRAAGRS